MMDEFEDSPRPDRAIEDEEPLEIPDTQIELQRTVRAAPEDGLPDPLATVRQLLPGGSGVRGKPPIVFSPTALDTELLPSLRRSAPTLVVLSGNAGDGKTAFVMNILEAAREPFVPGVNEYAVSLDGRPYLVVLDGSEDAADRSNEELLSNALGEFRGDGLVVPRQGTVIAVNKGRLLDFLDRNAVAYPFLSSIVQDRFVRGIGQAEDGYVFVDLNDRSVVAPDLETSLFGGVLERLTSWEGWDKCRECFANAECPALFNIRSLARHETAAQLWRVFSAIDLDDRIHVTARHLVTKIASTVASDLRCADVRAAVAAQDPFRDDVYFYNSVFRASREGSGGDQASMDKIAASYDPADLGSPRADRQIAFHAVRGSLGRLLEASQGPDLKYLEAAAATLESGSVDVLPSGDEVEFRTAMIRLTGQVARRMYFLEPDNELAPSFPLRAMDSFQTLGAAPGSSLAAAIPSVIANLNAALGIGKHQTDGLVVPKDYSRGLGGTGFAMVIPADRFELVPGDAVGGPFVERPFMSSWPRSLMLVYRDRSGTAIARLAIPTLMYEILDRAGRGFRPTSQTERSYTVRLHGFYRRVAERGRTPGAQHVLYDNGKIVAKADLNGDALWIGAA
jgi:hypothetical protein